MVVVYLPSALIYRGDIVNKLVFGLIGRMGSGKSTAARAILDHFGEGETIKFSDSLGCVLADLRLEHSRENMQNLSTSLRKYYGENILAEAVKRTIIESDQRVIIADGIRRKVDLSCLRFIPYVQPHTRIIPIFIDRSPELRFRSLYGRDEKVDDQTNWETFVAMDNQECEKEIESLRFVVPFVVPNNGNSVERYIEDILFIARKYRLE